MKNRDIRGQIYGGNAENAQKAIDNSRLKKRCILDEPFLDDEEEQQLWIFKGAEVFSDDLQENEDGAPPVREMSEDVAK